MDRSWRITARTAKRLRRARFPFTPHQTGKRHIFIHIPKTAGTSILRVLGKTNGPRDHLPWYVYYTANPHKFRKAYKFSFVRNPWDRALSAYLYLKTGGNQNSDLATAKLIRQYPSFESFVITGLGEGCFRNHLLFIPQSEFIVNAEGDIVVDFLGHFESLHKDIEPIRDTLQLKNELPSINKSMNERGCYRDYYKSSKSIDIIESVYRQDIKLFEYEY